MEDVLGSGSALSVPVFLQHLAQGEVTGNFHPVMVKSNHTELQLRNNIAEDALDLINLPLQRRSKFQ